MNFSSENVCDESRPTMFVYNASAIQIHKETALMESEQVNIILNTEGILDRI